MAPTGPLVYQKPILTSSDEPVVDTFHTLNLLRPAGWRLRAGEELDPRFACGKRIPPRGRLEIIQLFERRQ